MDQYIGLNRYARRLITRTKTVLEFGIRIHKGGKSEAFCHERRFRVVTVANVGRVAGTYKPTVAPLKSYTFPGGRVLTEFVQDVPWSGGPCYHIALRDQKGVVVAKSLWTDEELKNC